MAPTDLLPIYCGFDTRESAGLTAFIQSVMEKTPGPIAFAPIQSLGRDGSNAFTYARFDVPRISGYRGWSIWMDGADMLVRRDLRELMAEAHDRYAVMVVKHPDYRTSAPRKYLGTAMEAPNRDYPRKNWSSLILWNNEHPANRRLLSADQSGQFLHRFGWLHDEEIGSLDNRWNWLALEQAEIPDPWVVHFTLGIPAFKAYATSPFASEWYSALGRALGGLQTCHLRGAE